MRIAVSGTHGVGKSTLIAAFAARHPEFDVFGDPDDLAEGGGGVDSFLAQFQMCVRRLERLNGGKDAVLERCPLDFLAYLEAWEALRRPGGVGGLDGDLLAQAASAMAAVDLLVLLPVSAARGIHLSTDEDLDLREEMDAALLALAEDPDLVPESVRTIELGGDGTARLRALEAAL